MKIDIYLYPKNFLPLFYLNFLKRFWKQFILCAIYMKI